jgi:FkbM family methyltransferase
LGVFLSIERLPVFRRLIPSLRKRTAAWTWAGDFKVVRSNGAAFLVNFRNYVDRQIAFHGDYETAQHDYFLGEMDRRGCGVFIDVGANIGLYSVLVARRPKPPRIVAFEPDPRNYDQFRANLLINGVTAAVETHRLAVSNRASVAFRMASATSTGESRVDPTDPDAVELPAVRLDEFLPLTGQAVFIKIDIEGHELAALTGMAGLLRANRCFLQVECFAERLGQVTSFLSRAGFTRQHEIGSDRFFANF